MTAPIRFPVGRNYDTAEPDVKPALITIARIEQRIADIKGGDT